MKNQENPTRRTILVTGATGQQGGAVARLLSRRGHKVRGLTRNPDSAAAVALRNLGIEVVKGDLDDSESIQKAAEGVDVAFIMATPLQQGGGIDVNAEASEAINAITAVQKAGVNYLIYSSVAGADKNTGIPHFESKYRVEQYIKRNVRIPYTIVAPAQFMENYLSPQLTRTIAQGKLAMPISASRKLAMVAVDDLAGVVAKIVESSPEAFSGKRIEVASDELSSSEVAEELTKVTGHKVEYSQLPLEIARSFMSEDVTKMFEWYDKTGQSVNIVELKRENPEVDWHSFRDWARSYNWNNEVTVKSS